MDAGDAGDAIIQEKFSLQPGAYVNASAWAARVLRSFDYALLPALCLDSRHSFLHGYKLRLFPRGR